MKKRKEKKWWQYLLNIPIIAIVDILGLILGGILDVKLFETSEAVGHGFPVFIILISFILLIISIFVVIISVINAIKYRK